MQQMISLGWFCSIRSSMHQLSDALSRNKVTVKIRSLCLQYLQSYLKFFICHSVLQCPCWKLTRYYRFIDISARCSVLWLLVTKQKWVLFAAIWDKIPIFHLDKTVYSLECMVQGDVLLCTLNHFLIGFISYITTYWTRETESYYRLNLWDFSCSACIFAL